ncbi:hypothetical protein NKH77_09005 [Streptomyces sp. M19]
MRARPTTPVWAAGPGRSRPTCAPGSASGYPASWCPPRWWCWRRCR